MKTEKIVALAVLGAATLYLIARMERSRITGDPILVNPFAGLFLPSNPSPGGSTGTGSTNPLSEAFADISNIFKLPGNRSSTPNRASSPGTILNPAGPPDQATRTAQPERSEGIGDVRYLPNLGDPNLSAYDYLASTPPDLAWGIDPSLLSDSDMLVYGNVL